MNVRPEDLPHREFYRILISSVAPRPIAWVSTLSDGHLNLAPFSFFNVVSAKHTSRFFSLTAPGRRSVCSQGHASQHPRNRRIRGECRYLRGGRGHEPYQRRLREPPSGSLVIGEIVCVHLEEDVLKEGRLDPDSLDLIGRMGGTQYSRTTQRFDLKRPEVHRPELDRPKS
jgi:hypothetical protein